MVKHSRAVYLAWQIAHYEARRSHFRYVERLHVFIGLLKVMDALEPEVRAKLDLEVSEEDLPLIEREAKPLEEVLTSLGLERGKLRRLVRYLGGRGSHPAEGDLIHRSERCKMLFKRAQLIAEHRGSSLARLLHLLEAIMESPGPVIMEALAEFSTSPEALGAAAARAHETDAVGALVGEAKPGKHGATPFLDRYGIDLTRMAKEGGLDPLIGRREELLRTIRTLTRKTKNNPVLIGEPGVGKTAIVRGLASRIAAGSITPALRGKRLVELNMANLVAGTKYRGEFEERILEVMEEARAGGEIILFLDELHTVVGTGRAEGSMDAANIMKPALAAGEIRCIGATTVMEYRKYIEKDPALERRLQPIMVGEPTPEETLEILQGLREKYERHHEVAIEPSALEEAVGLASRYVSERRLPDKAIDVIDEACSRVRVDSVSFYGTLEELRAKSSSVTPDDVRAVVADWTGRPIEAAGEEEQRRLADMEEELGRRVIGQDEAVRRVSETVIMARAGVSDPRKPTGVFLFLGPTGVGKTELSKALAEFLFGSEDMIVRLDMSEYMEKHSVAKLVGAPPGYIGYEEEGQLTGRLRSRPYSVVLLDEIEKAHPEVLDVFLQLFDEGRLTDSKGQTVDARHAIFIMTSNIGAVPDGTRAVGFGAAAPGLQEAGLPRLDEWFSREFQNRIDEVIYFRPLGKDVVAQIASLILEKLAERLAAQGITMNVTPEALALIAQRGYSKDFGARPLARAVDRFVGRKIAEKIINGELEAGRTVTVTTDGLEFGLEVDGGGA